MINFNTPNSLFRILLIILLQFELASTQAHSDPIDELTVRALDEVQGQLNSYKANVDFGASHTSILVHLQLDESRQNLVFFRIATEWADISITDAILRKLPSPQLNSIDIAYTPIDKSDEDWSFSVRFYYGENVSTEAKTGGYSLVEFGIGKKGLLDVTVFDAKNDTSSVIFAGAK